MPQIIGGKLIQDPDLRLVRKRIIRELKNNGVSVKLCKTIYVRMVMHDTKRAMWAVLDFMLSWRGE